MSRREFVLFLLVQQQGDLLRMHKGNPWLFLLLLPLGDKTDYACWRMWWLWTPSGACSHADDDTLASPLVAHLQSVLVLAHNSFLKYVISLNLKSNLQSDACIFLCSISVVRLLWSPEWTL
jgi:hypothetical protein